MNFDSPDVTQYFKSATQEDLDRLEFGVIGFDNENVIKIYSRREEQNSGLERERVLDKDVFMDVAICMNNFLVALKFEENDELDEIVPFVLSLRMKPTKCNLRLLKNRSLDLNFILIDRQL